MAEITFDTVNVPVAVAAKALKMDAQTVRLLLQNGAVDWGVAYRRTPKSRQFSYIIYSKLFYESTGFLYKPDKGVSE